MKERFTVEKAGWSDERENQYRQECLNMAYEFEDELKVQNGKVSVIRDGIEMEVVQLLKPEKYW